MDGFVGLLWILSMLVSAFLIYRAYMAAKEGNVAASLENYMLA